MGALRRGALCIPTLSPEEIPKDFYAYKYAHVRTENEANHRRRVGLGGNLVKISLLLQHLPVGSAGAEQRKMHTSRTQSFQVVFAFQPHDPNKISAPSICKNDNAAR